MFDAIRLGGSSEIEQDEPVSESIVRKTRSRLTSAAGANLSPREFWPGSENIGRKKELSEKIGRVDGLQEHFPLVFLVQLIFPADSQKARKKFGTERATTVSRPGNVNVGYAWLVDQYRLPAMPLMLHSRLESRVRGRETRTDGHESVLLFEPKYHPGETLAAQLQFALKYEGVNLQVLALLFEQTGANEISQWLETSPTSAYARRAGYLYELLTGTELPHATPERSRYVPVLDEHLQFAAPDGKRNKRYRVIDNLPGCKQFCPLIRKSEALQRWAGLDLKECTRQVIAEYDPDLLRRAAAFLYLKETQSSFEVEREKPSHNRAQRFADLLRLAEVDEPLTAEKLAELQNAVIDPRFHEFHWRTEQNWIGDDLGYRKKIALVPARPEDLPDLMDGLLFTANRARSAGWLKSEDQGSNQRESDAELDPVVLAAMVAFGFVFIHPFMDGNGRIHRYLIHHVLAQAGFTPRGIVLPVSAVILANLDRYVECLEMFSKPLVAKTRYDPDAPAIPATGNDAIYFRYFDATPQVEFLYWALERTVTADLPREIDFLLGFDRARSALNASLDWPRNTLGLFIRLVHQNRGRLSASKRRSHFDWMTDEELEMSETLVRQAFSEGGPN